MQGGSRAVDPVENSCELCGCTRQVQNSDYRSEHEATAAIHSAGRKHFPSSGVVGMWVTSCYVSWFCFQGMYSAAGWGKCLRVHLQEPPLVWQVCPLALGGACEWWVTSLM